eukprot:4363459-Amphidinium_carterae.1
MMPQTDGNHSDLCPGPDRQMTDQKAGAQLLQHAVLRCGVPHSSPHRSRRTRSATSTKSTRDAF